MPQTRPRLEQITFKSAKTGTQNLDAYLEAAEIGNRTLASLMGDLFDANGNFAPEDILPEFRIDQTGGQTKLQYRTDNNAAFQDLIGFFNDRGNYANGVAYNALDLVTVDNGTSVDLYIVKSDQSNTAFSSQSEFASDPSTQLITTNSAGILQDVRDARDDVLQDAGFIAVSTDLQATPSKIQTVSDNLGTNQAVTVVADDLSLGTSSLVKKVSDDITNVNNVGNSIANVNTVAPQLTPTGDVTVVADDLNDASSNIQAVAGAITNVNNVGNNIAALTTVSQQIGTGLDVTVVADDLDDPLTSKIKITADNIDDVNTVADNIGVGQAITTVADDLNATPSNIANFVGGLDATIDDLTIQGVAKGAIDTTSTTTYDMSTANNYVFDRANGTTLTLSNAHLCANMQPFTIVVKEDGSSSFTISATNGTIKYANNVAPTLDGQSGRLVVLTGFVFEPDTVTPANTTIVICHTKVYS
jgi:hypothetical protein